MKRPLTWAERNSNYSEGEIIMRLKKILATVLTLALMASAAVCIPFTASAEYSGTKYTFEDFDANIYSGGGGVSGPAWSKETDDGTYLRYKTGWNMDINEQSILMSVCKGGTPAWNAGDKVGFTLGKAYDSSITVPDSFDGTASSSNIGIVFEAQASCWTGAVTFDIKSVTLTPAADPEQDDMTIDFSNHQTKASADDYGSNCVVQNTPFSNWTSVTEESGNRYLKLEKTGAAQDFKPGQWQYEADDGFNLICNQAGNVGWYGYEAPLKDAFVLKDNTEYFIKLRYRLKFTDGAGGTVPVKMLHTGKLNTASQALCECGIENNGVTLAEADGWKTVAFSATNKCTDSEDWNCFGLGFYDETVTDRNFELCVDEVTISSTNPMYGDADGNNEIDIRDLVRIKRYSAGITDEINSARADLDFDGVVGSGDLALLRRQLIG